MSKKVYLAGPIGGLTYGGSNSWREYVIERLAEYNIVGVSPMRGREELNTGEIILKANETNLGNPKSIVTRDRWDITQNCDALLANLLDAKKVSIGTMFEYAWADLARKPIITIMEKEGNLHKHAFVKETTGFRVETLKQDPTLVVSILNP